MQLEGHRGEEATSHTQALLFTSSEQESTDKWGTWEIRTWVASESFSDRTNSPLQINLYCDSGGFENES